ncbi:suppressor protein SRP40 [Iris pallida]|uniref:Suppressor protein SRP40 n=1 Tax=Iris pallida TaxID=29817 RepID=A0AAX6FB08_IRIPA|nr:suppressor protein SRP40 [Iris pallida]
MLQEASRSSSSPKSNPNPNRFVPRQVLLDPRRAAMADLKEHVSKKEKKRKNSEEKEKSGKGSREPLLISIAAFLESNGFVRTLAELRSEAGFENAAPMASLINLEDLFCSKSPADAATDLPKDNDSGKGDTSMKDEGEKAHDASEHNHIKKRKHKNGTETKAETNGNGLENGSLAEIKDKKKKKKKMVPHPENAETNQLDDTCGAPKDTESLVLKADIKDEEKRKKKHKKSSDSGHEESSQKDHKKIKEIVEDKIEELKSLTNKSSTISAETNDKQKGEKKKKKVDSNCTANNGIEESAKEAMIKSDSGEGNIVGTEENIEKRSHKKRKKAPEDGSAALAENGTVIKVSKRAKVAGDEDNEETETLPLSAVQDPISQDIQKESGQQGANCNLEKEKETGASAKSMKKEKRSAEPKTINAFQRVKVDEVKFADERLQDNSYWALDKTGSGYGAKAQEVLGQVRGRDFRHEKTKKKRGSYRGGQIDFESKSIKFDSDDE